MKARKRKNLEARAWRVGTVAQFLGLSAAEEQMVEVRLSLSREFARRRKQLRCAQAALAERIGSSQSRVAKMEAGDPSVSLDLLIRALFKLGMTREELSRALADSRTRRPTSRRGRRLRAPLRG